MKYTKRIKYIRASSDVAFIAETLSNDEMSSDKELVDHLASESEVDRSRLEKLVKKERSNFLSEKYMGKEEQVVKQYL